ncbi:MAG TPA: YDG domain-containing protein [Bacteroidota bacterium]|nr:YDG domain-containing protein [Bacteroidota bacterium]
MKRNVTVLLLSLLSVFMLTAAAQAQLVYEASASGRDSFVASNVQDGATYAVTATLNGSPVPVYRSSTSPPPAVTTLGVISDENGNPELRLFVTTPTSGLLQLTATLLDDNGDPTETVITGSKNYGSGPSTTPTITSLSTTSTSQVYGAIILTATVTGNPSGTPTSGTVTFIVDGTTLNAAGAALTNGTVSFHAEGVGVGPHSASAVYSGGGTFTGSTSATFSFSVTPAPLTVNGITADNKIYDGGTLATLETAAASLQGNVPEDAVSLNTAGAVGTFADKKVGDGKNVTISGLTITGASSGNYTLAQPSATASITPKNLTVSGVTASDKPYDGTTTAALNTGAAALVGVVTGNDVTLNLASASGSFNDKNAGSGKTVSVTGLTISGADATNYTLTQPSTSASINKAAASVTPVAATKVYGTSDPGFTGVLAGFVTADNITAAYTRTTGETVAGSYTIAATLSPAAALDNYTITYATAAFTITRAIASVTPTPSSKVYGAQDPALTGTLTGFVSSDNVTATYSRTPGESVNGSPYTISATLSPASVLPNYTITYNTANFNITTNTSTTVLSSSASTTVYGQALTFTATVSSNGGSMTGSVSFQEGSTVLGTGTLNASGVATFTTSAIPVFGSPHSIMAVYSGDGNFAGSTSAAVQLTVTTKTLTVTGITAANKVYDGSTSAVLNTSAFALTGKIASDNVTLDLSAVAGNFSDKTVGLNKTVAVSGLVLAGTSSGNYNLTQPSTTANITAKNLTVTGITANDKTYDGTTSATLNTSAAALVGTVAGDNVTLQSSGATGTFSDNQVGTNKTVTIAGLTLGGSDAGNYTLTQPTATASITAATNTGDVAGAGWVTSPAGAYPSKPTYTGKGYFVFAVGYVGHSTVPVGLTTFILKSSGLFSSTAFTFVSVTHEALSITGSSATLKGTGTINGSGSYGFLLTMINGTPTKTPDKIRMKIWNKNSGNAVYYDSQIGSPDGEAPTAAVTGGVITISKSGGSSTAANPGIQQLIENEEATEIPAHFELYNAYPNPFNPSTTIVYDLPQNSKVRLAVYDMLGREVAVLADGERTAGHYTLHFDASKLSTGTYIYRLQAGQFVQTKKLMLIK